MKDGFLEYKKSSDFEIIFGRNFKGDLIVPEKVTRIGSFAFSRCKEITSFKSFSYSLVDIGDQSFFQCENLNTVFFQQESNLNLGNLCFAGSKSLTKIEIVCKSVNFGKSCFIGCTNLQELTIKGCEICINNDCFKFCISISVLKFVKAKKVEIKSNQFEKLKFLKEVVIESDSDVILGSGCFSYAEKLESVQITGKTINISNSCFTDCSSLSKLKISNASIVSIGASGFSKSHKLEEINIGVNHCLQIGEYCFCESGIKTCVLEGNEIKVGKLCFSNCSFLRSLSIVKSEIVKFDEKAFENSKIKEIVIKAQKQFITDSYCFSNANELNSVLISSKKVEINSFCFLNCVSMTQFIVLEADDTQINDNVFDGCKALDTVKVSSKSHLKLGNFCFNAAANLKTVGISSQQIFFGSNCLDNCSSLSKIECNSAQVICCYKNSFKGMDSKEIINCPPETNVKIIENQNDDIFTIY